MSEGGTRHRVSNIAFLVFGFVSDFGFRISDLQPVACIGLWPCRAMSLRFSSPLFLQNVSRILVLGWSRDSSQRWISEERLEFCSLPIDVPALPFSQTSPYRMRRHATEFLLLGIWICFGFGGSPPGLSDFGFATRVAALPRYVSLCLGEFSFRQTLSNLLTFYLF